MVQSREDSHPSTPASALGNFNSTIDTMGQEETTDVEELGVVDQRLDLWLLEVVLGEGLGGSESGDERPGVVGRVRSSIHR